ncbi:MAG: hypothetical protein PHV20_00185 [Bacteroidales bacterium]|nr:hypothetical protein [Bacteroidales bacterium]
MEEKCIFCLSTLQINSKIYFCPFCLTQIKCKNCDELLLKGAKGCISCGTPIGNFQDKNQTELNQIEFEQKGEFRKFKATFTDTVGQDLVATFGVIVGVGAQVHKRKLTQMNFLKTNSTTILQENGQFQESEILEEDEELVEALRSIFKIDGENLIFQTSNLKDRSKLDKEIRMSLLVLLGYKYLHNSDEIKRQTLTDTLKKSKLNSSNFRRWISKCDEIVQLKGGLISLTPTGNTNALKILNEIIDSNITKGSVSFSKSTGGTRKSKITLGEASNSSNRSSKSPKTYLLRIIEEGFFSQMRSLSDITEHLKNDHAVTFRTSDISGHMGKFVNNKTLKREKKPTGYEYYV